MSWVECGLSNCQQLTKTYEQSTILLDLDSHFRTALPSEQAPLPTKVDPTLLEGTAFSSSMADVALWLGPYMSISSKNVICTRTENNFSRSLIRLVWMLQYVETLLPMAGEFKRSLTPTQPVLATSMPGGSCYPPVHELVRLRTTRLLRLDTQISADSCAAARELGSFASGGITSKPLDSSSYRTLMPKLMVLLRQI